MPIVNEAAAEAIGAAEHPVILVVLLLALFPIVPILLLLLAEWLAVLALIPLLVLARLARSSPRRLRRPRRPSAGLDAASTATRHTMLSAEAENGTPHCSPAPGTPHRGHDGVGPLR